MQEHAHNEGGGSKGFIGIALLIAGVLLGGIAVYDYFIGKVTQSRLSEILPQENLEFLLFVRQGAEKTPEIQFLETFFEQDIPDIGGFAVYSAGEKQDVVSIYFEKKEEKKPFSYCEVIQNFTFCSAEKSSVLFIADSVRKGKTPISLTQEYQESIAMIDADAPLRFFGRTEFLKNIVWEKFSETISEEYKDSAELFSATLPTQSHFFAGSIDGIGRELFFLKQEYKNFFSRTIAEFDLTSHFFPIDTVAYWYVSRPDFWWDGITDFLASSNEANALVLQGWAKNIANNILGNGISFSQTLYPLLGGDLMVLKSKEGEGYFFALPNQSVATKSFTALEESLLQKAASSLPIKVGHKLPNGKTMYEIFPNAEGVKKEEQTDTNGKFITFTNLHPTTGKEQVIGLIQKGSYLFVATDQSLLDRFWKMEGDMTDFVMPNKAGVFTSFGYTFTDASIESQAGEEKKDTEIIAEERSETVDKKGAIKSVFSRNLTRIEGKGVEKKTGFYFFIEAYFKK